MTHFLRGLLQLFNMSPLLQRLHRITQLPHPLPNPSPHLIAHGGRDLRRIEIRIHQLAPLVSSIITLLQLLRCMRLSRGRDIGRVEAVHGKQLVQGIAGGLAVRGGVDGGAGGAVGSDLEFVFGGFVAVSLGLFCTCIAKKMG
ncbi:hypothetical protein V6Z96_002702 [Aspergillus fumigatus]|jgi:hypothetical protein